MSDGITVHCVSCGEYSALKKEYNYLEVVLKTSYGEKYLSKIPVYTCQRKQCGKVFAMDLVFKSRNRGHGGSRANAAMHFRDRVRKKKPSAGW